MHRGGWWQNTPPPRAYPPWASTPRADTSLGRHPQPPRQTPPGQTPLPWANTPPRPDSQQAGGTHPTGMQSCNKYYFRSRKKLCIIKCVKKFKKLLVILSFWRWSREKYTYICLTSLTRAKWNFPLNFRTMRKLSDLYSGIFQTQSSGCASGVDLFRKFWTY